MEQVDRAPGHTSRDAAAILVAASIDSGADLDWLAADQVALRDGNAPLSNVGAARLAAVAAVTGTGVDAALARYEQLKPHLPGGAEGAAVIVANQLFAERRPGEPAPTYLYATETPDDD